MYIAVHMCIVHCTHVYKIIVNQSLLMWLTTVHNYIDKRLITDVIMIRTKLVNNIFISSLISDHIVALRRLFGALGALKILHRIT